MVKIYVGVMALVMLLSANANANANACKLAGAWELEYAIYRNNKGETVAEIKDKSTRSRKILSNQHFTFITWDKTGKFIAAGSGHYTLNGEQYNETVDATSEARLMGKTYEFTCSLRNDVWIHKGLEDGILIEEHWRKIK